MRYRLDESTPDAEEQEQQAPTAQQRSQAVEMAIQQAIRRGDFDNLPGAGKPLTNLGRVYDPDWWIRQKIQSERITGLGPPALTLRTEDVQLEERLDRAFTEADVRGILEDFNKRVIEARRQLLGGPPVVTMTRDIDAEVAAWRARRRARQAERVEDAQPQPRKSWRDRLRKRAD
ncbi:MULTISPECIES: DUF1992 domain-containing protein [unclassified Cryobacterium]|nr:MULTISPECIES: DUF1992 domain-containing protein [unclassified Cryobacterium]